MIFGIMYVKPIVRSAVIDCDVFALQSWGGGFDAPSDLSEGELAEMQPEIALHIRPVRIGNHVKVWADFCGEPAVPHMKRECGNQEFEAKSETGEVRRGRRGCCPPEKPQESLILGVPFSVVAESRLRVSTRHSPFYGRFQRWSDELSSFYLVFVWWSRRLGGHSHVAVM